MENVYYQITFFENKGDNICHPPYQGAIKSIKWLKFGGNDKQLPVNQEIEDESLAMRILIENLKKQKSKPNYIKKLLGKYSFEFSPQFRKTQETLENTILGRYEKVMVSKYLSNFNVK